MSFIEFEFIRKASQPDARSAEQASGVEHEEQASGVFQFMGPGLMGVPGDEPYLIGNENNGRQGIGAGVPGTIGMESGFVGINPGDAMHGLDSDGRPFFNDAHEYDTRGHDSMSGVVPIPSLSPSPLVAGDGRAQADGLEGLEAFDNASYGPVDFDSGTDE